MKSNKTISIEEFYNAKNAENYNKMMEKEESSYSQDLTFLFKTLQGSPGTILDISAGTGDMLYWLEKNMDGKFVLAGRDLSADMLKFARAKLSPSVDLQQGSMEDLSAWKDQSCCGLLCNFSIHHLKDCSTVLSECSRVLTKGGVLYLSAWEGEGVMPEEVKGVVTYYHSKNELNTALNKAKFNVIQQRTQTEDMGGFSMESIYLIAKRN